MFKFQSKKKKKKNPPKSNRNGSKWEHYSDTALGESLLQNRPNASESEGSSGPERSFRAPTLKELSVSTISIVSVVLNSIDLAKVETIWGAASGCFGVVIAILAAIWQFRLSHRNSLCALVTDEKKTIDKFKSENDKLKENEERLNTSVKDLTKMKKRLDKIAAKEKKSSNTIVKLIKESKEISRKQREINDAKATAMVVHIVLQAADEDFSIRGHELDDLCLSLSALEAYDEVEKFYEDRFRKQILLTGGTVTDVLRVLKNVQDPSVPEDEEIFKIKYMRLPKKQLAKGCI
mmetsp:Transcript_20190/g.24964  ORF Transcript_20190/g.24964 Transcript_20190/m.24964 type:complete len:292 (+) Transcript_20190:8-883(+)